MRTKLTHLSSGKKNYFVPTGLFSVFYIAFYQYVVPTGQSQQGQDIGREISNIIGLKSRRPYVCKKISFGKSVDLNCKQK